MITNSVLVIDANGNALTPCTPARARILLKQGLAKRVRMYPFVIKLHKAVDTPSPKPLILKIDPGSVVSGFALVEAENNRVIWAMELEHRGAMIRKNVRKKDNLPSRTKSPSLSLS